MITEKIIDLIARLEAYRDDRRKVREEVLRSGLIGRKHPGGHLVVLHNDRSADAETRRAAGKAAGALGALLAERITVEVAIQRLRLEAGLMASRQYPEPKSEARDRFVWENILSLSKQELIQAIKNEKNFGAPKEIKTEAGFRRSALRYSRFYKKPTRNFRKETPYDDTDTD